MEIVKIRTTDLLKLKKEVGSIKRKNEHLEKNNIVKSSKNPNYNFHRQIDGSCAEILDLIKGLDFDPIYLDRIPIIEIEGRINQHFRDISKINSNKVVHKKGDEYWIHLNLIAKAFNLPGKVVSWDFDVYGKIKKFLVVKTKRG